MKRVFETAEYEAVTNEFHIFKIERYKKYENQMCRVTGNTV